MYLLINIEWKKQTLKVDYSLNIKNRRLNTFTINIYWFKLILKIKDYIN